MATNNFAFEVKDMLGLESTHLESQVVKIWLNGPMANRVKVWKYFLGPFIANNNFAFEVEAIQFLESTHLESWVA